MHTHKPCFNTKTEWETSGTQNKLLHEIHAAISAVLKSINP
jgi:hypothetical protein